MYVVWLLDSLGVPDITKVVAFSERPLGKAGDIEADDGPSPLIVGVIVTEVPCVNEYGVPAYVGKGRCFFFCCREEP